MNAKNLNEAVKQYKADDILFIGSGTSFFFIGTPDEYNRDIDEISKAKLESALRSNHKANTQVNYLLAHCPELANFKTIQEYCEVLTKWANKLKVNDNIRTKAHKYIDEFTMLRTRKVKETYKRIEGDGTVILIEGTESGSYWFLSEYRNGTGVEDTDDEETNEEDV